MSIHWTPQARAAQIDEIFSASRIIPVITIERLEDAVPMAKALVDGGLRVLEVTLRTSVAVESIAAIAREVPNALVGAGTVTNAADIKAVSDAGAVFAISPGATDRLYEAADAAGIPVIAGIATASELMRGLEAGHTRFKFFPAESSGGVPMLKSFSGPFGQVRFCPTGGINEKNAPDYLALPNVMGIGGSWMLPKHSVDAGDWARIHELALQASQIG